MSKTGGTGSNCFHISRHNTSYPIRCAKHHPTQKRSKQVKRICEKSILPEGIKKDHKKTKPKPLDKANLSLCQCHKDFTERHTSSSTLPRLPIRSGPPSVPNSSSVSSAQNISVLQPSAKARCRLFQSVFRQIPQRRATVARIPDVKNISATCRKTQRTSRRYSEQARIRYRQLSCQGDVYTMIAVNAFMPLNRFKKAVRTVVLLLRAVYTDRDRSQRRERQINMWIDMSDSILTSRRAYETYGLTFDPQDFKANRQIQVTAEAKAVLSINTNQRSHSQIHAVVVSLRQAVPEFSEFPITMQESLARVGWYEKFEAKRVIIRQGHMADNFYFILSGTAVVIILETDKVTGEQKARTAAILGRGKSFGELALMHKARRSATVTCREDVELLAVGRDDFVDIFMHVERGVEPEHIRFLRSLPLFKGWPLDVLPYDNPKVLLFTYVRRGVVLCHDSNSSEWIFVIKSGNCRIIKCLPVLPKEKPKMRPVRLLRRDTTEFDESPSSSLLLATCTTTPLLSTVGSLRSSDNHRRGLPFVTSRTLDDQQKLAHQHIQTLDAVLEQRHFPPCQNKDYKYVLGRPGDSNRFTLDNNYSNIAQPIFVQVLKLGTKDIYGLEASILGTLNKTIGTSLVSDGAELIMINKKFFMDNTSSDLKKFIRKEIQPLPSEDSLQIQLKTQMEWESYRHHTLQKTMGTMRLLESLRR